MKKIMKIGDTCTYADGTLVLCTPDGLKAYDFCDREEYNIELERCLTIRNMSLSKPSKK